MTATTTLTPGIYRGVPAAEYHGWPAVSQTVLKIMRDRSPAHARYEMLHPTPPTPAMRLGMALHALVLQPDVFERTYAVMPDVDRRTREGRAAWEAFLAEHDGAELLTVDEYQRLSAMAESIMAHPMARALLTGEPELSVLWEDRHTGVLCKGRYDMLNTGAGVIVDLKTTTDASPRSFGRAIYNLGYHIQAAYYLEAALRLGIEADLFAIIAVEKDPPYAVAVYQIEDQALAAGEDELRSLLATYARCLETGHWPAYDEQAIRITLPRWAFAEIEERVGADEC